jgi:hypothetical protein
MSTEEQSHLLLIDEKLDEHSALLTDIRIAIARIESSAKCPSPGLCVRLQNEAENREKRLKSIERWQATLIGAWAAISLFCIIAWDYVKYSFKK